MPRILRHEASAAALFWNTQRPLQPGKGQAAAENLRFLEWFLHDYPALRGCGPLLAEFADEAAHLACEEESLLLTSLLAPIRPYEVTETLTPPAILVKDLLTGTEWRVGPMGLDDPPIRSDVVICRLLRLGRLMRLGASYLLLPAAGREEMLAYLRTAYRLARPARHVSLEDFLDGSPHLYHHFFLHRGRDLGGRARETLRHVPFAPGRMIYRRADPSRIRACLDRQPGLEQESGRGEETRYAWVDPQRGIPRAILLLRSGEVEVRTDTQEDLTNATAFLETCLRGLTEPVPQPQPAPEPPPCEAGPRPASKAPAGMAFLVRTLNQWADTPLPLLADRSPREACRSHGGRQRVAAILLGLERDLNRLKRLGRPSVDLGTLREQLELTSLQPETGRKSR